MISPGALSEMQQADEAYNLLDSWLRKSSGSFAIFTAIRCACPTQTKKEPPFRRP